MKIEIARKKIMEKDYHDSGKAMVQSMLMAWLEYGGEKVAEAICKEAKKDIVSDSYLAIREAARKKGSNSVYMAPDESILIGIHATQAFISQQEYKHTCCDIKSIKSG